MTRGGPVAGTVDLEVVDVAHEAAVGVDDLAVQQVQRGVVRGSPVGCAGRDLRGVVTGLPS